MKKTKYKTRDKVKTDNLFTYNLSLFEKIASETYLRMAFKQVKRRKGAPGIDGITVEQFASNLDEELGQLRKELLDWSYKPAPVRRVEIPKPDGKGVRLLGIPRVRDRVVQMAIKIALEPIFELLFSPNSFGFRPGRSQKQALEKALEIVRSGKEFTVDIDLSKFFDRINHDKLIGRLRPHVQDNKVLRLIGSTLRSGIMVNGVIIPSEEGSVQGSPLSPLLSNIVLDELDKELEKRGLEYCRFADDCNIFVKSLKAGNRVMDSVTKFIENKLKLKVNEDKSKVAKSEFVKFLGITIIAGTLAISKISLNRAMDKLNGLTPRGTHLPIGKSMEEINKWYVGWANYYKVTQYPSQFKKIESHIRRRLRARLVRQQKKRRHLVNKLVKMGVKRSNAAKAIYTNRGTWALSKTQAVEEAYSNEWFIKIIGQKIWSSMKLSHWFEIRKYIKLV